MLFIFVPEQLSLPQSYREAVLPSPKLQRISTIRKLSDQDSGWQAGAPISLR